MLPAPRVIHRTRATCQDAKERPGVSSEPEITAAAGFRLLDELSAIVARAAAAVLALSASDRAPHLKADGTPVTAADEAAQAVILEGLAELVPQVPVVSEESPAREVARGGAPSYVLVDPIDGTRELIAGSAEYAINVAIVTAGNPVVGVVAAPALGCLWRGVPGHGAERCDLPAGAEWSGSLQVTAIRPRPMAYAAPVAMVSRSHFDAATDAFLARIPRVKREPCGSALKFCRVAEGAADLYPRLAPTSEWDVAAGHAILAAAGGAVLTTAGEPLGYGRDPQTFRIADFIAWGDPAAARALAGRQP
jgi:3'(2'), 5'-bisphosphate nucleotidase